MFILIYVIVIHSYTWHMQCLQDTLLTVPLYPFVLDDPTDVPLEEFWFPCPSLFHLLFEIQGWEVANRPSHVWRGRYPSSVDVLQHLRSAGPALFRSDGNLWRCEVVLALSYAHPLYEPRLKCAGRVPLMPSFLHESSMPIIQHCFRNLLHSKVPYSCADVAKESGRNGSNVYEVNQCLWRFARGKPRLGGLSPTVCQYQRLRFGECP